MLRRSTVFYKIISGAHEVRSHLRIPYGASDFEEIRRQGCWWRDNSAFILPIVRGSKHQMLLRPPRFGKSLFASMLQCYLDVNERDHFEKLFGGTDVAKVDDAEHRNSYHVMKFDLSVKVGLDTADAVGVAFAKRIHTGLKSFCARYSLDVPAFDPLTVESTMEDIVLTVRDRGGKTFLIIDEYDRLVNKLIFEHSEQYAKVTRQWEDDAKVAPLRSFFEVVKATNARSFTTGITPIALADASGWNCCKNLTHNPTFGTVCGLREQDVCELLSQIIQAEEDRHRVFTLMKRIYNRYRFPAVGGVSESLFNTQMCLSFFNKWVKPENECFREKVLNVWSYDPESADWCQLVDRNAVPSESALAVLAKHPSLPLLQTGVASRRGYVDANTDGVVRLRELLDYDSPDSIHRLATFMYHHVSSHWQG